MYFETSIAVSSSKFATKPDMADCGSACAGDYRVLGKVGEGAFGTVFRARDRTGTEVALKRIRVRDVRELPTNAVREMNALRRVSHPNVVPLLGVHTHGSNIVLVMPFESSSLASLLAQRDLPLCDEHASTLGRMLFCGLCAIHSDGLLHRDIKPHNLLLSASGMLRIADFGQARLLPTAHDASLSHAVASRWYRAPELLLGSRRYGMGVDLWAAGCVLAQLHTLCALLPGESDIDQLFRVVAFLGSPTRESWPGVEALPDFHKIELPAGLPPVPLRVLVPLASDAALQLLGRLLIYDECRRVSARLAVEEEAWLASAPRSPIPLAALFGHALIGLDASPVVPPRRPRPMTEDGAGAEPPAPPAPRHTDFPAPICQRAAAPPEGAVAVRRMLESASVLLERWRAAPPAEVSR
jgi:serine/threonine protein kinase